MTHDPEEIKAVAEKIGKLYGYNVEAIARNVLDVLRPFRDREIYNVAAPCVDVGTPMDIFATHRVWVDDKGYRAQTIHLADLYRDMAADIEAARAGTPTASPVGKRYVGKHPALGKGFVFDKGEEIVWSEAGDPTNFADLELRVLATMTDGEKAELKAFMTELPQFTDPSSDDRVGDVPDMADLSAFDPDRYRK